jgi:type 1 fimbria pilin
MKKIFLVLLASISLFAVSCSKSDSATQVYFGKQVYAMLADTPLTIELKSSSAVSSDVSVSVNFGGTAVKDDEYTVSSNSLSLLKAVLVQPLQLHLKTILHQVRK